jgi:hypothetical protein
MINAPLSSAAFFRRDMLVEKSPKVGCQSEQAHDEQESQSPNHLLELRA